jgi:hypothetical protein
MGKGPRVNSQTWISKCNQDSGILGQGSTFFVREILDGICPKPGGVYTVKYFMLLRGAGVPPTQKPVVMIIFKSKYTVYKT